MNSITLPCLLFYSLETIGPGKQFSLCVRCWVSKIEKVCCEKGRERRRNRGRGEIMMNVRASSSLYAVDLVYKRYAPFCFLTFPQAVSLQNFVQLFILTVIALFSMLRLCWPDVSKLLLSDLPAPRSQDFDDLWSDGYGQWYSDEDEGLVDGVGENELCPQSFGMSA